MVRNISEIHEIYLILDITKVAPLMFLFYGENLHNIMKWLFTIYAATDAGVSGLHSSSESVWNALRHRFLILARKNSDMSMTR